MKDNKLTKVVLIVLLIAMIGLIVIAGSYARYTTTISGTDTATVAKFKVGSNTTSSTFDLFTTAVKEADGTTADSDVAEGKIAPGTGGKFKIDLTNDSDVTVDYALTLKETSNTSNIPVEYSLDGKTYVTASKFADLSTSKGQLAIGSTNQTTASVTVYWRWAIDGSASTNYTTAQTDATDTALGQATTAPTLTVEVSSTFTQVD